MSALAAVIGVCFASSLAVDAHASSPAADYDDLVADSESGPDIASVVVTQPTPAEVSFTVRFANRALRAEELLAIDFDTDLESDTGDEDGFEFAIEVFGGETTLWRWEQRSRNWDHVESDALESRREPTTLIVTVLLRDLRSPESFGFSVLADANPDDEHAPADLAPDDGRWRYPPADWGSLNWPLFGLLMSVIVAGTIVALFVPGSIDALRAPGWRLLKSPVLWPFAVFVLVAFGATIGALWDGSYPADQTEADVFRSNLMHGAALGAFMTGIVVALLAAHLLRRRSGASSFESLRMVVWRSLERKVTRRGSRR
ncbi:MAG: hypothetical protein R6X23_07090 [Acidimicrobiia bacterium]